MLEIKLDYNKFLTTLLVLLAFIIFLFLFQFGILAIIVPIGLFVFGILSRINEIKDYGIYLLVFFVVNNVVFLFFEGIVGYILSATLSIIIFLIACKYEKIELQQIFQINLQPYEFVIIFAFSLIFGVLFFVLGEPVGVEFEGWISIISLAIFSSFMEEVWFRYYLQKNGFYLQAIIFAIMHLGKLISLPTFVMLFVFALIAGRIRQNNGLGGSILFHFGTNFVLFGMYYAGIIFVSLQSYLSNYLLQERVLYLLILQLFFYALFRSIILYNRTRRNHYLILVAVILLVTTYLWTGAFGSNLEAFIDKFRFLLLLIPLALFLFYNYLDVKRLEEVKEKEKIKNMFSKYVSPTVVEDIIKQPELKLDGKRQEVSVLFCDIRGFTTLSEQISAEKVVEMLNIYYKIVTDAVFKHNGTVDKFIGDAVMVIFNAPLEQKDHCLKAVMTGIELQKKIAEYNKNKKEDELEINVGAGINVGEAVVGNVGTLEVMNYTVIGDPVNTAARMQSLSKAGEITITESVYNKVKSTGKFKIIPAGAVEVKGKTKPVRVYKVKYQ